MNIMKLRLKALVLSKQAMYHDEAMRAMVWGTHWSGGHRWRGSRALSSRCGWPVAFVLAPPLVLGLGVAAIVVLSVGLAVLVTVAAIAFSAALTVGIFGALGFVAWQVVRHSVPGLAGRTASRKRERRAGHRDAREDVVVETPVDVLRRRYASGEIGQTAFRQQLTDLLKERYVRGDLTLAEFESRVRHLYQDPALRPPAA
jgi:uncharacterized membrane protein